MDLLIEHGAEMLLHLGDIGTVEVIDALVANRPGDTERIPARVVFGNTDWDRDALADYAQDLGIIVDDPVGDLDIDNGRLVYTHGHLSEPMDRALAEHARYLCHGHTHRAEDQRKGATRIINPGALFRAQRYTVALLDTATDELSFLPVPDDDGL